MIFVVIATIDGCRRELRLRKDAKSDNLEVRREALYQLGKMRGLRLVLVART